MSKARVLLVEDDDDLRRSLSRGLGGRGFAVTGARDAAGAWEQLRGGTFGVVVVDIGLPDADGRDLCAAIRSRGVETPVVFLTARDDVRDRVSGFRVGGDDYLVKPFYLDELEVRLRAVLRRTTRTVPDRDGPETTVRVLPDERRLVGPLGTVGVTETEACLLALLLERRGTVVRHAELAGAGWAPGAIVRENTLQQYVARMRRKFRDVGAEIAIEAVRGVGYRAE